MAKQIYDAAAMGSMQEIFDACSALERLCAQPSGCVSDMRGVRFSRGLAIGEPGEFFTGNLAQAYYKCLMQEANAINEEFGCCGTEAMLIMCTLIKECMKLLTAGITVRDITDDIKKIREKLRAELAAQAFPGKKLMRQFLTTEDAECGPRIADAIDEVGTRGVIRFGNSGTFESKMEISAGHAFQKGFMTAAMANDDSGTRCIMRDPLIVVSERPIILVDDLVYFVTKATQMNKPLVLIAEHVEEKPLRMMLFNKQKGQLSSVAIQAPKFGTERKIFLSDIAALTGATVITPDILDLGDAVDEDETWMLGGAERVEIDKDRTVIFGGKGDADEAAKRLAAARRDLEAGPEDKKIFLADRVSLLCGKIAKIYVGGSTSEAEDSEARAKQLLTAAACMESTGATAEASCVLARAAAALEKGERSCARDAVCNAVKAPFAAAISSQGRAAEAVIQELAGTDAKTGWNADKDKAEDAVSAGLRLCPAGAVINAAEHALSTVGTLVSARYVVSGLDAGGAVPARRKTLEEVQKEWD